MWKGRPLKKAGRVSKGGWRCLGGRQKLVGRASDASRWWRGGGLEKIAGRTVYVAVGWEPGSDSRNCWEGLK